MRDATQALIVIDVQNDFCPGGALAVAGGDEVIPRVNALMADFLQWPVEDIGYVIGTDGKSFEGGIYMFDFDESARLCGVLEGDGPFGMANGSMADTVSLTNDWWIKLGLMTNKVDPAAGIDCSLMGDLAASGYRQTLMAHGG